MFLKSTSIKGERPTYLESGQVKPETVARFFHAAVKLYRVAPWDFVTGSDLLQLDIPDLDIRGACVSVIGDNSERFGLLIFESLEAFDRFAEPGEQMVRGDKEPTPIGVRVFSINFEHGSDVPNALRQEISQHGWEVANDRAYPLIAYVDPDLLNRPLTERDVVFATALAEAVGNFFAKYGDQIEESYDDPICATYVCDDLPGQPRVEIIAPHPEQANRYDDDNDDDEIHEEILKGEKIVEAFLAAQKTAGRDSTWLDAANFVCHSLYDFKLRYADGVGDDWTADLVEEYMLEFFPEKITADKNVVARVPELIVAFFDWMKTTGGIKPRRVEAIRKRVATNGQLFLREANNPQNFGSSKALVMAMRKAGVDPKNQREVDRFIVEYNERMLDLKLADTQFQPLGTEQPSKPPRARWVRSGDEPVPDPNAPCPCGSGQRYKKCCKPR